MNQKTELQLEFTTASETHEINTAKSWRGVSVQYARLKLPTEYEFRWDGETHYLAHHDLILDDGEMEVLGEKKIAGRDLRDQMTYTPQGQTISGWARPAARLNAFTVVSFDPAALEEELQIEFNAPDPRAHIYFKDHELGSTMRKLGRLLGNEEGPASNVYAETLGLTAALEMFRLSIAQEGPRKPAGGRVLSPSQRDLLQGYILENLSMDIGLDELASVCGLTRFHFSRSFKATFGEAPYQYLTRRRVERAQQMLRDSQISMTAIATACGFNGVSQFARSFRGIMGQTPLAFRRGL